MEAVQNELPARSGNRTSVPETPGRRNGDPYPTVEQIAYKNWQERVHSGETAEQQDWTRAEQEVKGRSGTTTDSTPARADRKDASRNEQWKQPDKSVMTHDTRGDSENGATTNDRAKVSQDQEHPDRNTGNKDAGKTKGAPQANGSKDDNSKQGEKQGSLQKLAASGTGSRYLKIALALLIVLNLAILGYFSWQHYRTKPLGPGFASGNGRIEAVETDVSAETAGRVREIYVDEGDTVEVGQVVARLDVQELNAELKQSEAQEAEARNAATTAIAVVGEHEGELGAYVATLAERESDRDIAAKNAQRSGVLAAGQAGSVQESENDTAKLRSASSAVIAAQGQIAASQATIAASRSQAREATSNIIAARAAQARLRVEIAQGSLKSARGGRVQFRVMQPGEIVQAGGKVLNMVDLSDVSITFFLPEGAAGKVAIGSDVHIVLDAAPGDVIPAKVSFVDSIAQFTPKSVETQSERQKLVFRVKAKIPPELLKAHVSRVKSGLPGMAYVRLDPNVSWPEKLQVKGWR